MTLLSRIWSLFLLSLLMVPAASAQYVAVTAGGLFPQDLSGATRAGNFTGTAHADFDHASSIGAEAGFGFLPFLGIDLHYSYSKPGATLQRGDLLGSSAKLDLSIHTLTLDLRVHAPAAFRLKPFGFVGGGFSRFSLDVKQQVEVPFPNGIPSNLYGPVISYGGGFDYKFLPLIGTRLEIRDDVTPIVSNKIFQPEGSWHRLGVSVGVVLGR